MWGAWALGMAAGSATQARFARMGMGSVQPAAGLQALFCLLSTAAPAALPQVGCLAASGAAQCAMLGACDCQVLTAGLEMRVMYKEVAQKLILMLVRKIRHMYTAGPVLGLEQTCNQ